MKPSNHLNMRAILGILTILGVAASANAQELITNGTFSNGLTGWSPSSWAGGSSFGTNANGPANTSASSGNYAFAGGGTYNLLQQGISGVTNGGTYRLTFLAGSKSGGGQPMAYFLFSTDWRGTTTVPASTICPPMPCLEVTAWTSPPADPPICGCATTWEPISPTTTYR